MEHDGSQKTCVVGVVGIGRRGGAGPMLKVTFGKVTFGIQVASTAAHFEAARNDQHVSVH
jgi:hypothetical protein